MCLSLSTRASVSLVSQSVLLCRQHSFLFFFNDTATTEIYTLSLHDALPIYAANEKWVPALSVTAVSALGTPPAVDRKSTRLNSSHSSISYAVFCLKKKNKHYRFLVQHGQHPLTSLHFRDCRSHHLIADRSQS